MNNILTQQIAINKNMTSGFLAVGKVLVETQKGLQLFAQALKTSLQEMTNWIMGLKGRGKRISNQHQLTEANKDIASMGKSVNEAKSVLDELSSNLELPDLKGLKKKDKDKKKGETEDAFSLKETFAPFKDLFDMFSGRKILSNFKEGFKGTTEQGKEDTGFSLSETLTNLKEGLSGGLKGIFDGIKGSFSSLKGDKGLGSLKQISPQMIALMLLMKPIMALVQGLLEPFEPLFEVFSMLGELIGMIFTPIINEVTTALIYLISNGSTIIPTLQTLALSIFNLLDPITLIIGAISKMAESGMTFGEAMATVLVEALAGIMESVPTLITQLATFFINILTEILTMIPDFMGALGPAITTAFSSFGDVLLDASWEMLKAAGRSLSERTGAWWNDLWN